ncbi:MAG: DUF1269 domain-containing protein [Thermoleophilia bacterium]
MASLTVWKFNDPGKADEVLGRLEGLQKQALITIQDAAVVSWPPDKKKPKTRQLSDLTAAGGVGGAFWGLLFGLIFFVPLLGMAIGAVTGAIGGHFAKVGIDDDFIDSVREKVTPGTSALFLMSANAVVDRVAHELGDIDAELISTNLSEEDEAALRAAFAEEE